MTIEEITKRIEAICYNAEMTGEVFCNSCSCGDYEWELGVNIVNKLRLVISALLIPPIDEIDERITLYGVPVRITYNDPNKIKLWRAVDELY